MVERGGKGRETPGGGVPSLFHAVGETRKIPDTLLMISPLAFLTRRWRGAGGGVILLWAPTTCCFGAMSRFSDLFTCCLYCIWNGVILLLTFCIWKYPARPRLLGVMSSFFLRQRCRFSCSFGSLFSAPYGTLCCIMVAGRSSNHG